MRLFAGLATGVAVAVVVAYVLGTPWPDPNPSRWIRQRLQRSPQRMSYLAELGVSPARFWLTSAASALSTFVVVWAFTASAWIALVPAGVVATVPAGYYQSHQRRRGSERLRAWPDALRSIVASLQAGGSPHEALVELAVSGPVPLRPVFTRYRSLAELVPEATALELVRDELADPVADRVFEVLVVAVEKGSRIALEILRDIADATTADIQLAERLETAQSEQRLQARAVFVLPFLTLVILSARPGPFREFYSSPDGVPVLLIGAALSTAGMLVVRRLGRLPAEPRVVLRSTQIQEGRR
jgi:tight adherence protein B